jgi:hypothetical protein
MNKLTVGLIGILIGGAVGVFNSVKAEPCLVEDTPENVLEVFAGQKISDKLKALQPGDTLTIHEGTYNEYLTTSVNGTVEKPITIKGEGNVILRGSGDNGRLFQLFHDHYIIEGIKFTNADKLLYAQEADNSIIRNNEFYQGYGECVRLKYLSSGNVFENNLVHDCGVGSFVQKDGDKNGEGVYIGTASEQLYKNPTKVRDESNDNIIRNNTFNTQGNECIDIKEAATGNIVEGNSCTGQKDTESGGMDSRGSGNTFRNNKIYGNLGAGIRFGGDKSSDGVNNNAYGNTITDNKGYAIKAMRWPQGKICGNTHSGNKAFTNESRLKDVAC